MGRILLSKNSTCSEVLSAAGIKNAARSGSNTAAICNLCPFQPAVGKQDLDAPFGRVCAGTRITVDLQPTGALQRKGLPFEVETLAAAGKKHTMQTVLPSEF